ncbi:MAG: hypothetical protein PHV11_05280 [Candidatus Bipolaricaulis sp.]|nr:hypothetical protein [Candidatus Bipolaricaulis sp.]MDD5219953.1 hypothetical protein [Candidatus Bipolaricaulis sp.]MDD5647251.1 hypothetical protein [Candidatus Bipolaricaulis sp.]
MSRVISGACAAGSVVRLIGSLGAVAIGTACRGRRAVRSFYRGLRRAGLSPADADRLTEQYAEGMSIRGLFGHERRESDD